MASQRSCMQSVLLIMLCQCLLKVVEGQAPIPPRYDGFVYRRTHHGGLLTSVLVEAFFDPLCPYSRDAWPPLKRALKHYSRHVTFVLHPFPLPYHDNAFVASRGLHIADKLNSSATYPLLELFFNHQEKFYSKRTRNMTRTSIVSKIAKLMTQALGEASLPKIKSGFEDTATDRATRISFKYACSRTVTGTPTFYVNGFPLPEDGSDLDYKKWRSIIDPLLSETGGKF